MQKKTAVNKEAFKMLALEIGLNAACRKLSVPIPTGKSWARRGGWKLPKRPGGRPGRALTASSASSLHPIADALAESHKELEEGTRSDLARATRNAAAHAAVLPDAAAFGGSEHLQRLAAAASRLFGWDAKNPTSNTYNTLVVTTEQLQQIRALREQADGQENPSDTPGCP
jgi:hypothetical protein